MCSITLRVVILHKFDIKPRRHFLWLTQFKYMVGYKQWMVNENNKVSQLIIVVNEVQNHG